MVQSLKAINRPIEKELKIFEQRFREDMRSRVPLFDTITYYIVQRKGKQVRPMFVFLTAKLFGKITDASYHAASLVELLHTATLVHNDVVDNSQKPRGLFSLNAMWKNKIAVLVGDFFMQKGFIIALENKRFQLLEILSNSVKEMSEGELLAVEKARKFDLEVNTYLEIIRLKTASLISGACAVGAASTTDDPKEIERMKSFGEKIGMAFQIRDELLEFGHSKNNSPLGMDFNEKPLSLPLVYALENASFDEKRKIIHLIHQNKKTKEVVAFVKASGAIEYTQQRMQDYRTEAIEILKTLPPSEAKTSIEELVDYVIDRKK